MAAHKRSFNAIQRSEMELDVSDTYQEIKKMWQELLRPFSYDNVHNFKNLLVTRVSTTAEEDCGCTGERTPPGEWLSTLTPAALILSPSR